MRPAPAITNSTPSRIPTDVARPPAATVRTRIATPMATIEADRIVVASRRIDDLLLLGRLGLDDHAARALGQDDLQRLAEQRRAAAPEERHDDRPRPHR